MIRDGHDESVSFFTGTEVEHTPAYGLKTLFVVGVQSFDDVSANLLGCEHIYFGANMSFPKLRINDAADWRKWENMINPFLKKGYLCTLDIDVSCTEGLLESGLTEHYNFIPMISVKLPYLQQLGYNATIKLDDRDFDATNPGVWCHSLHDLQKREAFTPWSKYTKDETL
tara:strand:- start:377 stop:886 length:510 start_codon:yes stop_codon:yes gene_type:complete